MSRRISDETKRRRKMGTGSGASYIPYIHVSEFSSLGTASVIRDWKTGRAVHCLSQAETMWYYVMRWDDNNVDIREQYPLDYEKTSQIALEKGIRHPGKPNHIMTTDFLVTEGDGTLHAYSVKPDRSCLDDVRTAEKLFIEKIYWLNEGCRFSMLYKTDVNRILETNIRLVVEYYRAEDVKSYYDAVKHKIAVKEYDADTEMRSVILDAETLRKIGERYANER